MRSALVLLAAMTLAVCARAQAVYRCEAEGSVRYEEQPCAQGREVSVADPRTAAQRADAQEAARREAALALAMRQERLARESMPPSRAIGIGPSPSPASAAKPKAKKGQKDRAHKPHAAASSPNQS